MEKHLNSQKTKESSKAIPHTQNNQPSPEGMALIPAGTYIRYSVPQKVLKVQSRKGHDLWIDGIIAGYIKITEEVPEKLKQALEKDPSLKEKLKGRKLTETKIDFIKSQVVPLKLKNGISIQFALPEVDFVDPLEIEYVLKFPEGATEKGQPVHEKREKAEYNAAYHSFMPGGFAWMFDPKEDPGLLKTGKWFIHIYNKGKKITSIPFLVVEPGKEKSVGLDVKRSLAGMVSHKVSVDSFYLDKHEVTNSQFLKVMGYFQDSLMEKKTTISLEQANLPADLVQWEEARDYCEKIGKHLPTEAEWEWAARSGRDTVFPWGNFMENGKANFCDISCEAEHKSETWEDGFEELAPVGSFPPNGYGLYDMAGNQVEWVSDWFDPEYYGKAPTKNPVGPPFGEGKVVRGGSYYATSNGLRVSERASRILGGRHGPQGFRCAFTNSVPLKETEKMRYLEAKPPKKSREFNSMSPLERVEWKARDTLFALKRACEKLWEKEGNNAPCNLEKVTDHEFGFKNKFDLPISMGGDKNSFHASIIQTEGNFRGKKQEITYQVTQFGGVDQTPNTSHSTLQSGGCVENLEESLEKAHQQKLADISCGVDKVSVDLSDWECVEPRDSLQCKEGYRSCARAYGCRTATPEQAAQRLILAHEQRISAALNRLHFICRDFFESGGTQGECKEDLKDTLTRGLGDVDLVFKGKGEKFTATATGGWRDKQGQEHHRSFRINAKGEIQKIGSN